MSDLPRILTESIDNLIADNSELKAQVSILRDAIKKLLENPESDLNTNYAKYVLRQTQKEIGRKCYYE